MPDLASFASSGLTPALTLAAMDRHLGWALVLTAATLFMLQRAPRFVRFALAAIMFIVTIAPTTWSLSHWLGLAYQTPSLVMQGLALLYLLRTFSLSGAALHRPVSADSKWPLSALLAGSTLGWILVLDTFAVFPVSLYALGYSEGVVIFGLVLAAAFWTISLRAADAPEGQRLRHLAIVLLCAVAIHTFTRLPSGNAWDMMLDPWLWLVIQGVLLARFVRFLARKFKGGKGKAPAGTAASSGAI